ncbi:MAG: hypothetical protein V5A46_04765 [Haloferacaceae archaeon]
MTTGRTNPWGTTPGRPNRGRDPAARRGQLVLVAAAVVALALVPMAFAYLQLGYHGDVDASAESESPLADAERSLELAVENASAGVDGEYAWSDRDDAVAAFQSSVADDAETIERLRHAHGVVVEIDRAEGPVQSWRECPSGPMRDFGPCERAGNVVIQERAGETTILAAGYRVRVATPDGRESIRVAIVTFE